METTQRKTPEEKVKRLFHLGRHLVNHFESSDVSTFDYDPVRNRLFLESAREDEQTNTLTLKGIFKAEIFTEGLFDDTEPACELVDIGTIRHAHYPHGHLNPPHIFFVIGGVTEYRFWCRSVTINNEEFELSKLFILDSERKRLGLPPDWQPPVKNEVLD